MCGAMEKVSVCVVLMEKVSVCVVLCSWRRCLCVWCYAHGEGVCVCGAMLMEKVSVCVVSLESLILPWSSEASFLVAGKLLYREVALSES